MRQPGGQHPCAQPFPRRLRSRAGARPGGDDRPGPGRPRRVRGPGRRLRPRGSRSGRQGRVTGEQDNRAPGQAGQGPGNAADAVHGDLPRAGPDGQHAGAAQDPTGPLSYPGQSPSPCQSRIPLARYGARQSGLAGPALTCHLPATHRSALTAPMTPAPEPAASLPRTRLPAQLSAVAVLSVKEAALQAARRHRPRPISDGAIGAAAESPWVRRRYPRESVAGALSGSGSSAQKFVRA